MQPEDAKKYGLIDQILLSVELRIWFLNMFLYTERKGIDMEDNTKNSSKLLHCSFVVKIRTRSLN